MNLHVMLLASTVSLFAAMWSHDGGIKSSPGIASDFHLPTIATRPLTDVNIAGRSGALPVEANPPHVETTVATINARTTVHRASDGSTDVPVDDSQMFLCCEAPLISQHNRSHGIEVETATHDSRRECRERSTRDRDLSPSDEWMFGGCDAPLCQAELSGEDEAVQQSREAAYANVNSARSCPEDSWLREPVDCGYGPSHSYAGFFCNSGDCQTTREQVPVATKEVERVVAAFAAAVWPADTRLHESIRADANMAAFQYEQLASRASRELAAARRRAWAWAGSLAQQLVSSLREFEAASRVSTEEKSDRVLR